MPEIIRADDSRHILCDKPIRHLLIQAGLSGYQKMAGMVQSKALFIVG